MGSMLNLILMPVTLPLRLYGAVLDRIELYADFIDQTVGEAVREFERNVNEFESGC